jgi:Holliday junction DNA helicase RuvA
MIGRLVGKLVYKKPPELLMDVHGIGYELLASMSTFYHLPEPGEEICLYTQLIVREDSHTLYAFYDMNEREMFRELIKVNGVGPKSAITILSSITPEEFTLAVMQQDTARLTKLPGIGKKTAERLVIEMRDRLTASASDTPYTGLPASTNIRPDRLAQQEAISALIALGYKPPEASRAINHVPDCDKLSSEEIIRAALKQLMR